MPEIADTKPAYTILIAEDDAFLSRVTNGFAGLRLAKKQKQEIFASRKQFQNYQEVCAAPAAGPDVHIGEISQDN